jgi:hypothetical protein
VRRPKTFTPVPIPDLDRRVHGERVRVTGVLEAPRWWKERDAWTASITDLRERRRVLLPGDVVRRHRDLVIDLMPVRVWGVVCFDVTVEERFLYLLAFWLEPLPELAVGAPARVRRERGRLMATPRIVCADKLLPAARLDELVDQFGPEVATRLFLEELDDGSIRGLASAVVLVQARRLARSQAEARGRGADGGGRW